MKNVLGVLSAIFAVGLLSHWMGISKFPIVEPIEILAAGILLAVNAAVIFADSLSENR